MLELNKYQPQNTIQIIKRYLFCISPISPLSHLFAAVDDVFWEGESADGGAADDRVVAGRRVRHLHRAELQERLAQRYPTQQQLSAIEGGFLWLDSMLYTGTSSYQINLCEGTLSHQGISNSALQEFCTACPRVH